METYEEIVSRWYSELHDPFVNLIKSRFNGLFFDEIEDIYQETFLAVHENLHRGSIEADTNWRAYIMRIGLNQTMTYCKAKGKFVTASQAGGDDDDVRPDWLSEMAPLETQVDESTDDPKERADDCCDERHHGQPDGQVPRPAAEFLLRADVDGGDLSGVGLRKHRLGQVAATEVLQQAERGGACAAEDDGTTLMHNAQCTMQNS